MKDTDHQPQPKEAFEKSQLLPGVRLVIFDIDDSLVVATNPEFYHQYGPAVNQAVASYIGVDQETGKMIADYYRHHFGGGEQALFSGTIGSHFPQYGEKAPDFDTLFEIMNELNPRGYFTPNHDTINLVQQIRKQGIYVAAITSTAEGLSRKILAEYGFNPDIDFDLYKAYTRESGPPKMILGTCVFTEITEHFGVSTNEVLSIGDSYRFDVAPAVSLGMKTCLISDMNPEGYTGMIAPNVQTAVVNFGK